MENSQSTHPNLIALRRKDRAITDEAWIENLLETSPYAMMACNSHEYPFLHANTFWYDRSEKAIYFHTAHEGAAQSVLTAGQKVVFMIAAMGRLLPGKTATNMSVEYQSVQVKGVISVIDDLELKRPKMQALVDKYFTHLKPGKDYQTISDTELQRITAYKLEIQAWTGKRKAEREDFAGAFEYHK